MPPGRSKKGKQKNKNIESNVVKTRDELCELFYDFCDILLEKIDVADLNSIDRELKFFDSNDCSKVITNEINEKIFYENIEWFHNKIETHCYHFVYKKSTSTELFTPYSFYEHDSMELYVDKLKDHFSKKFGIGFPIYFDYLFMWLSNKAEEFKVIANYNQDKINFEAKRNQNIIKQNIFGITKKISAIDDEICTTQNTIANIDTSTQKLNEKLGKLDSISTGIDLRIKNVEKETKDSIVQTSISILGVFSAVVLTFNMGISFAADALEVFMKSSGYHSVLVIVLFGFIIGNVLFALFAYLRHIHVPDATEKIRETLLGKVILIFNSVLLVLFIANTICWVLGAVEERDNCIANKYPATETTMQEDTTIYDEMTELVLEQSE